MMEHLEALNSDDRTRVEERVDELGGLVQLVALRPDLKFSVGAPNSPWSFRFDQGLVSAPVNDLTDRSADYCRGLAMHEAAHASVTRIFDMIRSDFFSKRALHSLFNCIEDCRIETWMKARSPGCAPWIRLYNDRLFSPILHGPPMESHVGQFNMGLLAMWWFNEMPPHTSTRVVDALERTRDAVSRAIGAQPPRIEINSELIRRAYEDSRTLRFAYMKLDRIDPPSDSEQLIRLRQLQMVQIVLNEVMPVYRELIEADEQQQKSQQMQNEMKRLLDAMRGHHVQQSTGQTRVAASGSSGRQQAASAGANPAPVDSASLGQSIEAALSYDPRDKYLTTWAQLSTDIDRLCDELMRVFQKSTRTRWLSNYPSGARLDIRKAMSFDADPRLYTVLWQRKSKPQRIEPAFFLVLDRSGSMNGARMEGAFRGLVLLTEVCTRLGIPVEIISFANEPKQEHTWDTPIDEDKRDRLGKLPGRVGGGTALGAALSTVETRLSEVPFKDRFAIVLSDGLPGDESTAQHYVRRLENQGVKCVGLGLGQETEALARFFDSGLYNVTSTEVAERLAELLRARLLGLTS